MCWAWRLADPRWPRPAHHARALGHPPEGDQRGWYGGLVGDRRRRQRAVVAIRCLLLAGNVATAFAGAGIVADSIIEREVTEIGLKLRLGAMA
jgi:isochorismate synthase EntC